MAGPAVNVDYVTNIGVSFQTKTPTWQNTVAGNTPGAATGAKPANLRKRYRMIKSQTTGKEFKIMVGDVTHTAWTATNGTVVAASPPDHPADTYEWAGRIGERILARG